MAVATLSTLNPELEFTEVPAMQVTHGSVVHQEGSLLMAQTVFGRYAHLFRRQQTQRRNGRNGKGKRNGKRATDNHEFPQYAAFIASQTSERSYYSDDVKRPICNSQIKQILRKGLKICSEIIKEST